MKLRGMIQPVGTAIGAALLSFFTFAILASGPRLGQEAGNLRTQDSARLASNTERSPQPGEPRSWEGSVQVSPYSWVNLAHGNTFTMIESEGLHWEGHGPDVKFALCHNTAAGLGWSSSPAHIEAPSSRRER